MRIMHCRCILLHNDERHDAMLHPNENKSKKVSLLHFRATSMTKRCMCQVNDRVFDSSLQLFTQFDVLGLATASKSCNTAVKWWFQVNRMRIMHFRCIVLHIDVQQDSMLHQNGREYWQNGQLLHLLTTPIDQTMHSWSRVKSMIVYLTQVCNYSSHLMC